MILVVDIGNTTVSFGGVTVSPRGEYRVTFTTKLDLTDNEIEVVLCGGQLRFLKNQLAAQEAEH